MKLVVVVAHPDDETFGTGSVIARAAAEGAEVVVCCATRGEAGEPRPGSVPPGRPLGEVREAELREAADLLGARRVVLLDFEDSGWDGPCGPGSLFGAPIDRVVDEVRAVLRHEQPDVVVTMDPTGGDGHRDHKRIAEATTVAFDAESGAGTSLYHWVLARSVMNRWIAHNRGSVYEEVPSEEFGFPDELVTTEVDVADLMDLRWRAIRTHRSQASPYDDLPDDLAAAFLATDRLVRARPAWTGGPIERRIG